MCLMVLFAPMYASSVGIPSSANVIRGSFFLSSSFFFRSSFCFLMASLSSFFLFFSKVLGERAPVVALSSLFLFFFAALASAAFLASSSLCASPAVSPAYSAWPKMAVKDANPSGVLVSIAESSEALKWSEIIFLNLSSLLSPPLDPEPPPPVPAIAIRSAQAFLRQFSSNAENEFKFRRRFTLGPQKDFITPASRDSVSLHLRDFRQFRSCDVTRIGTCDMGFITKAVLCCYFRNVGGLRSRGLC